MAALSNEGDVASQRAFRKKPRVVDPHVLDRSLATDAQSPRREPGAPLMSRPSGRTLRFIAITVAFMSVETKAVELASPN